MLIFKLYDKSIFMTMVGYIYFHISTGQDVIYFLLKNACIAQLHITTFNAKEVANKKILATETFPLPVICKTYINMLSVCFQMWRKCQNLYTTNFLWT